jgi:hypothetical protein
VSSIPASHQEAAGRAQAHQRSAQAQAQQRPGGRRSTAKASWQQARATNKRSAAAAALDDAREEAGAPKQERYREQHRLSIAELGRAIPPARKLACPMQ